MAALWAALAIWLAGTAGAHLQSSFNVRVIHFQHHADGLTAYLRLSLPLVVANGLGPKRGDQTYEPAPYTYNRLESGRVFHYVDEEEVRRDVAGLARLAADGHRVVVAGKIIEPRVLSTRVHPKGFVPPFNSLEQARAAAYGPAYPAEAPETDAGYALVDVALFYPLPGGMTRFQITSSLRPGLLGEPTTNNLLLDHREEPAASYAVAGLLDTPVTVNPSPAAAFEQFLSAGLMHILDGPDHILFVVCLVIGASSFGTLAWRITGFSVGHSVTLAAGFYGLIPAGAWFAPAVEIAIALSILYAALLALSRSGTTTLTFSLTALVGMLHGFGFAFGLRQMLAESSPNLGVSLLSFNLGVEVGQLGVALCAWLLLHLARNIHFRLPPSLRIGVAGGSAAVALVWLVQRVPPALSAF